MTTPTGPLSGRRIAVPETREVELFVKMLEAEGAIDLSLSAGRHPRRTRSQADRRVVAETRGWRIPRRRSADRRGFTAAARIRRARGHLGRGPQRFGRSPHDRSGAKTRQSPSRDRPVADAFGRSTDDAGRHCSDVETRPQQEPGRRAALRPGSERAAREVSA